MTLDLRLSRVRTGDAVMRQDYNYKLETTKLGRKRGKKNTYKNKEERDNFRGNERDSVEFDIVTCKTLSYFGSIDSTRQGCSKCYFGSIDSTCQGCSKCYFGSIDSTCQGCSKCYFVLQRPKTCLQCIHTAMLHLLNCALSLYIV